MGPVGDVTTVGVPSFGERSAAAGIGRRYQDWGGGSWGWNVVEGRTFSLSDRLLTRAMGPSASPTHTLTYDARGRVTGDGEYTYAWDVRDRLTTVTRTSDSASWTFAYDATGRLTTMVEGAETVRLRWRGSRLRGESIEASGTTTIERTYRADGIDQGGTRLAMVRDVRGSVTGLALAGSRVRTYRYGVWGEQTVVAPGSGLGVYDTHMGFTGHVVHRPTGLVFAPARVYSPRLRQWLTRDPLGERDAVDGRNLYAYVAGDPVNYVDPSGRYAMDPTATFFGAWLNAEAFAGFWAGVSTGATAGASFGPVGAAVGGIGLGVGAGIGTGLDAIFADDIDQAIDDAGYLWQDISRPLQAAPGNVSDTGIMEEARALVASGRFPNICAALEALYNAARCGGGDSARAERIKRTQKAQGCRGSRHSRE